jgi:hypothetical protein
VPALEADRVKETSSLDDSVPERVPYGLPLLPQVITQESVHGPLELAIGEVVDTPT